MYFSGAGTSSEQLLFQKKNFLGAVTFSEKLVLLDVLHSTYTWKDFPLTSIHSFKYTMIWSDLEIPLSFIVENSKRCMNFNTGCVTNVTF